MDRQSGRKIWKIAEFYNELMFLDPALEQAVHHKGRTYNYYWTMPGADNMMSACHAMELSYVFINPQVTIYTGGLYNGKLADTVREINPEVCLEGHWTPADMQDTLTDLMI